MGTQDIRWKQQFASFRSAKRFLDQASAIEAPSDVERMGLIQAFEVTVEAGWKTLRSFMKEQGQVEHFAKEVIRRAYQYQLITDAETWLRAIDRRSATSHTYDHATVVELETEIRENYLAPFDELEDAFSQR